MLCCDIENISGLYNVENGEMKSSKSELHIWANTFRDPNNTNEDLLVIRHINQEPTDDKINEFRNNIMYLQHNTVYTKPIGRIRSEGDIYKIGDFVTHQWCEKYITNKKKG